MLIQWPVAGRAVQLEQPIMLLRRTLIAPQTAPLLVEISMFGTLSSCGEAMLSRTVSVEGSVTR